MAQVRGGGHALSSTRLVARCVALAAQANGWRVVDLSSGTEWGAAPIGRLSAVPTGTPVVLHLGTGDDRHLAELGPAPPGPVLVVHHGSPQVASLPDPWVSAVVSGVALAADDRAGLGSIGDDWTHLDVGAWTRLASAVVPDATESALLAAHRGPHLTASGPISPVHTRRWVGVASLLVQECRTDATVAVLPAGRIGDDPGSARQIAELGLASCQLTTDATLPLAVSHLRARGVYLRAPGAAVDPVAAIARSEGCRIVASEGTPDADTFYEPDSLASVAAAVDVALDLPRRPPTDLVDDSWLWPLLQAVR